MQNSPTSKASKAIFSGIDLDKANGVKFNPDSDSGIRVNSARALGNDQQCLFKINEASYVKKNTTIGFNPDDSQKLMLIENDSSQQN